MRVFDHGVTYFTLKMALQQLRVTRGCRESGLRAQCSGGTGLIPAALGFWNPGFVDMFGSFCAASLSTSAKNNQRLTTFLFHKDVLLLN